MILDPGKPDSKLVFSEQFRTRQAIESRGGILVATSVGAISGLDGGLRPTGVSGRVTFGGTESLLVNSTQMTIACRFKTGAANIVTSRRFIAKNPAAFNDNQIYVGIDAGGAGLAGRFLCGISSSAADLANFGYMNSSFALGTEYVSHVVYNGGLAAADRLVMFTNGSPQGVVLVGTIPVSMRANNYPLTVFNAYAEALYAPPTDFVLRSVDIYSEAWSAQQVADDYARTTYPKVFGGPS